MRIDVSTRFEMNFKKAISVTPALLAIGCLFPATSFAGFFDDLGFSLQNGMQQVTGGFSSNQTANSSFLISGNVPSSAVLAHIEVFFNGAGGNFETIFAPSPGARSRRESISCTAQAATRSKFGTQATRIATRIRTR